MLCCAVDLVHGVGSAVFGVFRYNMVFDIYVLAALGEGWILENLDCACLFADRGVGLGIGRGIGPKQLSV